MQPPWAPEDSLRSPAGGKRVSVWRRTGEAVGEARGRCSGSGRRGRGREAASRWGAGGGESGNWAATEKTRRSRGREVPASRWCVVISNFVFTTVRLQVSSEALSTSGGLCLHAAPPLQPAAPRLPARRPAGEESPTPFRGCRPLCIQGPAPVWAPQTSNASRRGQRCSCGWGDPEPLMGPQGKRRRRLENVLPIPHPFLLTRPRARVPLTTGS